MRIPLLSGRQNDLVVGAEILRGIRQCSTILLHDRQDGHEVGAELLGGHTAMHVPPSARPPA
jgi:hypothetical protein